MPLRLYLDEDSLSHSVVRALRARGVDVVTAAESGLLERSDSEHLANASEQRRAVCTFNVGDFYRLHAEHVRAGKTHAGIVLVQQQRYSLGELIRRLLKLDAMLSPEAMENRVEFLSAWEPD